MTNDADCWKTAKERRESSRDELLAQLRLLGVSASGSSSVRCFVHDDQGKPNAAIQNYNGKWYFKCFKCADVCFDVWDLEARVKGVSVEEILGQNKNQHSGGDAIGNSTGNTGASGFVKPPAPKVLPGEGNRQSFASAQDAFESYAKIQKSKNNLDVVLERTYPYYTRLEEEYADYIVFRGRDESGRKHFPQTYKNREDNRWYFGNPPSEYLSDTSGRLPLFNRKRISESENILVVEGEWCVEAFTRLNVPNWAAVCSPEGAAKAGRAHWHELEGKRVYLWADNDEADKKTGLRDGQVYIDTVKKFLEKSDTPVFRIRHEELDLPPKGDIVDYLNEYKTEDERRSAVAAVVAAAEDLSPAGQLAAYYRKIGTGGFRHIHFSNAAKLSDATKAIVPGTISLMCGDPGAGKSYFILEQAWRWHEQGESVALLELEKDLAFWQNRAHAQMAGFGDLTDFDWCEKFPDMAQELAAQFADRINSFSRSIWTMPTEKVDAAWMIKWTLEMIRRKKRIIIIDPITFGLTSDKIHMDSLAIMTETVKMIQGTNSSVFFVTHPRNDAVKTGKPSLGDLAGGTAFYRFADCVLWFKQHKKKEQSLIDVGAGRQLMCDFTHEMQVWKSRYARGNGGHIAFGRKDHCFSEIGEIIEV